MLNYDDTQRELQRLREAYREADEPKEFAEGFRDALSLAEDLFAMFAGAFPLPGP